MEAARRSFWEVRILGEGVSMSPLGGVWAGAGGLHLIVFPYCWAELLLDVADARDC
jgi:hypothetical protein